MITFHAYHGSPYKFDRFREHSSGLHFGTFDQAAHAAMNKLGRMPLAEFEKLPEVNGWRGNIMLVRITCTKIKRVKDSRTPAAWSRVIKKALEEGYDALVYANDYEGRNAQSESYLVMNPAQIEIEAYYLRAEVDGVIVGLEEFPTQRSKWMTESSPSI